MSESKVLLGIDVGSSSVRALVMDSASGQILATAIETLEIRHSAAGWAEQSSDQIWMATCNAVRHALHLAAVNSGRVVGIGFDATSSLVVLDYADEPLAVSTNADSKWNVIMWMDHRAGKEAEAINLTGHDCLKCVGGKISLEMEPPKLLWLKRNNPQTFECAGKFLDLADFLTYKATGVDIRSLCTVVSKWCYLATPTTQSWDYSFWNDIGLPELPANPERFGRQVDNPGEPISGGLSPKSAQDLGLLAGTAVAVGIIDVHAGTIGCLATKTPDDKLATVPFDIEQRLSLICGTSTSHMVLSKTAHYVPGIWGPYYGAVLPEMYLNEAGQTATGSILKLVLDMKPETSIAITSLLDRFDNETDLLEVPNMVKDVHVWPDYHGNRSPLADSTMKGAIVGLTLDFLSDEFQPTLYLAHVFALAYGTRFIVETLQQNGHKPINMVFACGGLAKNLIYIQAHADVLNVPVVVPNCDESVALGAALLAAVASKEYPTLSDAMAALGQEGSIVYPRAELGPFHERKYSLFRQLGDFMAKCK